jgi:hypothetical protein
MNIVLEGLGLFGSGFYQVKRSVSIGSQVVGFGDCTRGKVDEHTKVPVTKLDPIQPQPSNENAIYKVGVGMVASLDVILRQLAGY